MEYVLSFSIMVDTKLPIDIISIKLTEELRVADSSVNYVNKTFNWMGNCIELIKNDEFNSTKATDKKDGYIYYRYCIEIAPLDDNLTVENQIECAKEISRLLIDMNCKSVICADFEELL